MNEIPQMPAMPRRPFDVDEYVPLPELLAAADRHEWAVVAAGCGVERRPAREVAGHALAVLALGAAVVVRLEMARGATIRDALAHGASLAEVAEALDMYAPDVVDELDGWADMQVRAGAMDAAERAEVAMLVLRTGGGAR